MKLYWIIVRLTISFLLLKFAFDTGLWLVAGVGLLVGLSALSEFLERLTRAVHAMKE